MATAGLIGRNLSVWWGFDTEGRPCVCWEDTDLTCLSFCSRSSSLALIHTEFHLPWEKCACIYFLPNQAEHLAVNIFCSFFLASWSLHTSICCTYLPSKTSTRQLFEYQKPFLAKHYILNSKSGFTPAHKVPFHVLYGIEMPTEQAERMWDLWATSTLAEQPWCSVTGQEETGTNWNTRSSI